VFLFVKTFKVFLIVFGITLPKPKILQGILENGMLASTSVPFSKMPCVFQEVFSHDTWHLSDPWVIWEVFLKKISLNLKLENALGVGKLWN